MTPCVQDLQGVQVRGVELDTPRPRPSPARSPSPSSCAEDRKGWAGCEPLQMPMRLDFEISYIVPERKIGRAPREILRDASGSLRPGRLTAILGPSGTGKTSCISILAGQRTAGVRCRVLVNGAERSPPSYRHNCVLIGQDLALLCALTARETLRIAADLKLPASKHSTEDRNAVVCDIARTLGLEACLDTAVAHLSGGEKKRLSVGVELVTNPPIMLFDEPTSGLDSVSSVQVVSHLRSLALSGRTVAVVLHQPSSRLFQLFDDLVVLGVAGGPGGGPGRSLYCGPADQAAAAFSAAGFVCPTFYNIADFVVEVASGEHGTDVDALLGVVRVDADDLAEDVHETDAMLRGGDKGADDEDKDVILDVERTRKCSAPSCSAVYPVSFWTQFVVLFKRSLLVSLRDMNMAWLRLSAHLLVAVMLGFLYKDIGNEASKVTGNVACIFFFVLFLFFSNAMPTVLTFPCEATVFFREHSNNWYSLPAYYLSKVLADLPFMVLNPTVFLLVAYYLTDQPTDDHRRCMVWLLCLLTVLVAHAFGLVLGAALGMQLGVFMVPASTIPLILFSGFFLNLPDIPFVLQWISYVSNFRYGFEGIVITTYGMNRQPLKCSLPYCHWRRPTKFLEDAGMLNADYWTDVTGLVVWLVVLHLSLLIVLKVKVILSRR